MKKPLRILSLSDIHLGHHKTPADYIVNNLMKYFPPPSELDKVDLIILGGDVFDRLLDFNSDAAFQAKRWMHWVMKRCLKHKIALRVLEGTPSHDHKQNLWWRELLPQFPVDMIYIDTLSIERMDDLDMNILWVPDEWNPSTDQTWLEVNEILVKNSLTEVDFSVIHGTMDHQVPNGIQIPYHITDRYLSITKHYVLTGHIHQSALRDRCLTNGSFDRLCHGDEGKKGYWDITINDHGDDIVFVENTSAKKYITLNLIDEEDDYTSRLDNALEDLEDDSHVRLIVKPHSSIINRFESIRHHYGKFYWTLKTHQEKVDGIQSNLLQDSRHLFEQTLINEKNIVDIISERLSKTLSPELTARCIEALKAQL